MVGGVKKEVGRVTKNRKLEAKGAAQKGKGSVQETAGKAARRCEVGRSSPDHFVLAGTQHTSQ